MSGMRAAAIVAKKTFTVADLEPPALGPDDVRVRQVGSALNPVDLETADGSNHMLLPVRAPFAVGVDVAGAVEAVGSGVTDFSVGDRVVAYTGVPRPGALAELVTVPAAACARVPEGVTYRQVAALPLAGLCAQQGLDAAGVGPGKRVLVHGAAGAVGNMAVQIAVRAGAEVVATARAPHHAKLRAQGVAQVVDYTQDRFESVVDPVDVVFDVVGGDTAQRSWSVLRAGGTLVSVKALPHPDQLRAAGFRVPGPIALVARVAGWFAARPGAKRQARLHPLVTVPDGAGLARLVADVAAGRLAYDVDRVFPLGEIDAAVAHVKTGRPRGRVLIDVAEAGALA